LFLFENYNPNPQQNINIMFGSTNSMNKNNYGIEIDNYIYPIYNLNNILKLENYKIELLLKLITFLY